MKKKFLLAVIPALMVLTSCAGAGPKDVKQAPQIIEDTLAHEEIFGGVAEEVVNLGYRAPRKSAEIAKPITGVQYADQGDGTYAVRYVAAIEDYEGVEAIWTRAVCLSNGNQYKTFEDKKCTQAYTTLSSSDGEVMPGAVPSAFGSFNYFVVYTLRNIPSDQLDSYLVAYLTLKKDANEETSLARVSSLGQGNTFTFDQNSVDGYFLQGEIGDETIVPLVQNGGTENYIQQEGIPMNAEDHFGVFKYDEPGNCFQCFGNFGSGNDVSRSKNRARSVFNTGTYNIYISKNPGTNNVVYFNGTVSSVRLYLNAGIWDNTTGDLPRFAAYAFNNSESEKAWFNMTATAIEHTYQVDITASTYDKVIFCRMDKNNATNAWNNEGGTVWNQTDNLAFPSANTIDRKIAIEAWSGGNGSNSKTGSWYSVDI